jgi:hypothetical protein
MRLNPIVERAHALWLSLHFCRLDCLAFIGKLSIIRPWRWPFAKLWPSLLELQEIRVLRQNLRRNSYLNAGSQSRDSRKKGETQRPDEPQQDPVEGAAPHLRPHHQVDLDEAERNRASGVWKGYLPREHKPGLLRSRSISVYRSKKMHAHLFGDAGRRSQKFFAMKLPIAANAPLIFSFGAVDPIV